MRTLYYPAQQGKQAEFCRTLAAAILNIIRDPVTAEPVERYQHGFSAADLRNEGIVVPHGGMTLLSTRGWIVRSPAALRKTTAGVVWILAPEAVRFLDERRTPSSSATEGATV